MGVDVGSVERWRQGRQRPKRSGIADRPGFEPDPQWGVAGLLLMYS